MPKFCIRNAQLKPKITVFKIQMIWLLIALVWETLNDLICGFGIRYSSTVNYQNIGEIYCCSLTQIPKNRAVKMTLWKLQDQKHLILFFPDGEILNIYIKETFDGSSTLLFVAGKTLSQYYLVFAFCFSLLFCFS